MLITSFITVDTDHTVNLFQDLDLYNEPLWPLHNHENEQNQTNRLFQKQTETFLFNVAFNF